MPITTVPVNDRVERFTASGGQTVFTFDFPVYAATDIEVRRQRSGVETVLAYGGEYTVTGAGSQAGGTVTLSTGAIAGDIIVLRSNQPTQRSTDFTDGGDLPADALDAELNRIAITLQQQGARMAQGISVPYSDPVPATLPPVAQRANRYVKFDASGNMVPADLASATAIISAGWVDVTDPIFAGGARGNGTTDDSDAFLAAIATGHRVYAPGGRTYRLTKSMTGWATGQVLFGDGPGNTILAPEGNIDLFVWPSGIEHVGISGMTIAGAALTGGYLFYVNGADRVHIENLRINSPWNVAYITQCNAFTAYNIYGQMSGPSGEARGTYCFHLFGNSSNRSDVLRFDLVNFGGQLAARNWTGIYWDGFVNTVIATRTTFVAPLRGLHTVDSTADGVGYVPTFGRFFDLEVDFPLEEGIRLDAGINFEFSQTYPGGSANSCGIYVGPNVADVQFTGGYKRGSYKEGMVIAGQDVRVLNSSIEFNSLPNYGTYDGIRVEGTARNVQIIGNLIGSPSGAGATARYGVSVEAGALSVRIVGCDFYGCYIDHVLDNSGSTIPGNVEIVGCGSRDQHSNERPAGLDMGVRDGRGALLTPTISGGAINSVAVAAGGSNYTLAPTVAALDPAGTGSGFAATAVLTNGAVSSISVSNPGSGYSAATKVVVRSTSRVPTIRADFPGLPNAALRLEGSGTGVVQLANAQGVAFQVQPVDVATVNFLTARGRAAGTSPDIIAAGADTNIDIGLFPKGTGRLVLGGPTAGSAGAIAAYLEIKVGATTYKLPLHSV